MTKVWKLAMTATKMMEKRRGDYNLEGYAIVLGHWTAMKVGKLSSLPQILVGHNVMLGVCS